MVRDDAALDARAGAGRAARGAGEWEVDTWEVGGGKWKVLGHGAWEAYV